MVSVRRHAYFTYICAKTVSLGAEGPSPFNDGSSVNAFGQRLQQEPGPINGGMAGSAALNGNEYGPIGGIHSNQATPSRVINRDAFGKPSLDDMPQGTIGLGGSFSNHNSPFVSHAQAAFPQAPLAQFASQDNRSLNSMTPISDRQPMPFAQQIVQPFSQSPSYTSSHSPWHAPEPAPFRRPGPFDVNHPTASNTFVAQPAIPAQAFPRAPQPVIPNDQSPWAAPSQPTNEAWNTAPTASLTAANLGQHDEQLRQADLKQQAAKAAPEPVLQSEPTPAVEEPQPLAAAVVPPAPSAPSPIDPVSPQKPRRKSSTQPAPVAQPTSKAAPPAAPPAVLPAKPPSPASPPEAKAAWAIDEDKKNKPSGLNLREIQEAEAKKLEARKAAERERERAARASTPAEDFQPFKTTWGLPTSQAGVASSTVKESTAASPLAGPAPVQAAPAVWTNAAKAPVAAKKTMKEIQEEEERRKKMAAKEKESMAATARRAHADAGAKVGFVVALSC